MMESLRISEARPYPYGSNDRRTKESWHHMPRLPTPEESQSSSEALERQTTSDGLRFGSPHHATHSHRSPHNSSAVGNVGGNRLHRKHASPPDSPPYGGHDLQRPSLPPLKTVCCPGSSTDPMLKFSQVLGNSLSSPPQTPTSYGASGPLSPREPAFMTTTYKPPSLYPNKKPRTDFCLEPVPSTLPTSTLSSPGAPSAVQYPRVMNASQPPPSAYHSRADMQATRRMSVRYPPSCSSPDDDATRRSAVPHREIVDIPQNPSSRAVNSRPQMMPRPSCQVNAPGSTSGYPYNASHHSDRKSSMDVYGGYGSRPYDVQPSRNPSYHRNGREAASPRDHPHAQNVMTTPRQHGLVPLGDGPGLSNGPHETLEAPFFMPSHYEYHQGKARKRSNLPKQSTEIMKTWFDQVITYQMLSHQVSTNVPSRTC